MENNESITKDEFRISLSVSPFADREIDLKYIFNDEDGNEVKTTKELQKLFMKFGANEVFALIATERFASQASTKSEYFTDHSLERALEKAKMAKELGLVFNPQITLFKYLGHVMGQPNPDFSEYPEIKLPGKWETLTLEEMIQILKQYGAIVAKKLVETGANINVWDIGNEVEFGFAGVAVQPFTSYFNDDQGPDWYKTPDRVNVEIGKQDVASLLKTSNEDRIPWLKEQLWPYQAKLMNAVCEGILEVAPEAKFSTHIALSSSPDFAVAFYQSMLDGGFKIDIAGFSFYPSSALGVKINSFEEFKSVVKAVNENLGLPVFIAEYAYPASSITYGPYVSWSNKCGKYELSPEGQSELLYDLTTWGIGNGICGIRPWAPEFAGSVWEPLSLFSMSGMNAISRPALNSMYKAVQNIKVAD